MSHQECEFCGVILSAGGHDDECYKIASRRVNQRELEMALRAVKPLVHRCIAKCPEDATPAVLAAETQMLEALR